MSEKPSRTHLRSVPPLRRDPRAGAAVLALRPPPAPRMPQGRWGENVATVAVRGDLDREALWAIDYTITRAAAEAGRIVLDLRDVTHVDYSGVPELVARGQELRSRGGDLRIVVRSPYVANILRMAGGPELSLFRSIEEAAGAAQTVTHGKRLVAKKGT